MDAEDRANELYWGSDHSVNQIADDLDLSKGALYEMIRPLPAGLACPTCGAEVVHPNRTAKDRARVECASCGWHGTEDEALGPDATDDDDSPAEPSTRKAAGRGARDRAEPVDEIYPVDDYDATVPPPARIEQEGAEIRRLIAGGALLGAAAGLALVIWARRR